MLPAPAPVVVIQDDDGGQLLPFLDRLAEYRRKGVHVRILGRCISACTVVIALPRDHLCVGPDAELGFHQSSVGEGDNSRRSDQATDYLFRLYPPGIRSWISSQGGMGEALVTLNGRALQAFFPPCYAP